MKFLILCLFAVFQVTNAEIHQYKFNNGVRVIILDNFYLPIAKVGVVYHFGLNQLKNKFEKIIVSENFISNLTKRSIKKLGINCDVNIYNHFTEICATVSPEQIIKFIKIILENVPEVRNLEKLKNRIEIEDKLNNYFESNAIRNEVNSGINPKDIFNLTMFRNLTEDECKNVLKNYESSPFDIIICGKTDFKKLIEQVKFLENYPKQALQENIVSFPEIIKKNVEMRSKFFSRSINFIYQIPFEKIPENYRAMVSVISNAIFDYFCKNSQIITDYSIYENYYAAPFFIDISFRIKRDVSLKMFEQNYKTFWKILKKSDFSVEKLLKIAKIESFLKIDRGESIESVYRMMFEKYILNQKSVDSVSEDIMKITGEDIIKFVEEIIEKNLIFKLVTKYKADN